MVSLIDILAYIQKRIQLMLLSPNAKGAARTTCSKEPLVGI